MQSHFADQSIVIHHLAGKFSRRANEQPAQNRRGNRIVLPSKG